MIDPGHPRLSVVVRQYELVSISRLSFYREATPESAENLVRCVSSTSSSWRRRGTARGRWHGIFAGRAGASVVIVCGG